MIRASGEHFNPDDSRHVNTKPVSLEANGAEDGESGSDDNM